MMNRILIILSLALLPLPVSAQEESGRWIKQAIRSSCSWWENCESRPSRYVWRYVREIPRVNVEGYRDDRSAPYCQDFVTAVGEERYGRDRAKEAAEQTWMEAVRAKHGTKWMDLRNSHHGTWECGRSSTGNRASEKAQDLVGKFLEQCELKAKPCRAERERVEK